MAIADVFILQLVKEGLATAYALHARGGISVGTAHPALARLVRAGLLTKSRPGRRASAAHRLTPAGHRVLDSELKRLKPDLDETDIESMLRSVVLALAAKRRAMALCIIDVAIRVRKKESSRASAGLTVLAARSAEIYVAMKTSLAEGRRRSELGFLSALKAAIRSPRGE